MIRLFLPTEMAVQLFEIDPGEKVLVIVGYGIVAVQLAPSLMAERAEMALELGD